MNSSPGDVEGRSKLPENAVAPDADVLQESRRLAALACILSFCIAVAMVPHALSSLSKAAPTDRGLRLTGLLVWFAPAVFSMLFAFTRRTWVCALAALWYIAMGGVNLLQPGPLSGVWVAVIPLGALLGAVSGAQLWSRREGRRSDASSTSLQNPRD